jgi:hypothetical protein
MADYQTPNGIVGTMEPRGASALVGMVPDKNIGVIVL